MSPPSPGSPALSDDEYPVFLNRQTGGISLNLIREQFGELQATLMSDDLLSNINQQNGLKEADKRATRQRKNTIVSPEKLLSLLQTSYAMNCSLMKLVTEQEEQAETMAKIDNRFEKFREEMRCEVTELVSNIKDKLLESVNESLKSVVRDQPRNLNDSTSFSDIVRTPTRAAGGMRSGQAGSGQAGSGQVGSVQTGSVQMGLNQHGPMKTIGVDLGVKVVRDNLELEKREKNQCDVSNTVLIKGVTDFDKFVRHGYLTTRAFHKFFPNTVIKQAKPTRQGTLLLEMLNSKDAEMVVNQWRPHFFTNAGSDDTTSATLLANTGTKTRCVAENVDPSVRDEEIVESLENSLGFKPLEVKRMKDKSGALTPLVTLTFSSTEERDKAVASHLRLEHQICVIRPYYQRKRPSFTQCYKCFKFGHSAVWCSGQRRCPHCCDDHAPKDCPVISSGGERKCPNCPDGQPRNHSANSVACPIYHHKCNHG